MKTVTVNRDDETQIPGGSSGRLGTGTFECDTMERDADGDHPRIPAGSYKCTWKSKTDHPLRGPCYEIMKVTGRTAILIHAANWPDQLLGCLALGRSIGSVMRPDGTMQTGLMSSKDALFSFENDLDEEDFLLVIR